MDTLRFEPRASRMRGGFDATTYTTRRVTWWLIAGASNLFKLSGSDWPSAKGRKPPPQAGAQTQTPNPGSSEQKNTNGTNSKRRKKTIAQGQKALATKTPGSSKRLRPRRDGPSSGEGSSGQKKSTNSQKGGGGTFLAAPALCHH